jgi:hypothetical protein
MARQWDATVSGYQKDIYTKRVSYARKKQKVTVLASSKEMAKEEIILQALAYGFVDPTIDHMVENK